ncbi:MAG: Mu transposase C-terminal domain-containing protein [Pseudomonadota bacterium]
MTAPKEWLTANEIAKACLPGLPTTKRRINTYILQNNWQTAHRGLSNDLPVARRRVGRGGGWEYHIDILPPPARAALDLTPVNECVAKVSSQGGVKAFVSLPRPSRPASAKTAVRMVVMALFRRLEIPPSRSAAFVKSYNSRQLDLPSWFYEVIPQIAVRSIERWACKVHNEGSLTVLSDDTSRRGRKCVIETASGGEPAKYVIALKVKQPHLSLSIIRDLLQAKWPKGLMTPQGEVVDIPTLRTLQTWWKGWRRDNPGAFTYHTDPDKWRSKYEPCGVGAYRWVKALNQLWEIDASPADVLLADGKRWTVYVGIDVWSRSMVAMVAPTARSSAVRALTRKMILALGVPTTVRTDNGSDFKAFNSLHALAALGISHDVCDPREPAKKAIVERAIGTLNRSCLQLLDGYIGASVADRKKIEARLAAQKRGERPVILESSSLSASDLQAHLDAWIANRYDKKVHSTLAQTPEARRASWTKPVAVIENERALDVLLADLAGKDGLRVVTKQGLSIERGWYGASALGAHVGQKVLVRHSPEDWGRVWVFTAAGTEFIAEAICYERAGINSREAADQLREAKVQAKAHARKVIGRAKDMRGLSNSLAALAHQPATNLHTLPRAGSSHKTPALEAATQSIRKRTWTASKEDLAAQADLKRCLAQKATSKQETPKERFTRARHLEDRLEQGKPVEVSDVQWLQRYQTTAEYEGHAVLFKAFSPTPTVAEAIK